MKILTKIILTLVLVNLLELSFVLYQLIGYLEAK